MHAQVQSLLAPIRAISMGGLAHEYVCGDRLRARASQAIDRVRYGTVGITASARYRRILHASGLVGAVGMSAMVQPITLPLNLLVGTGRHRYTGPERLAQGRQVITYVEAFLDHPLDTGLLGLVSAYNLAKHAMIAGTFGAVFGGILGLVLWPMRGLPHRIAIWSFVDVWVQRGAFAAGVFGALMGSCFIWAPHNYIVVQCLRVLTAVPQLVAIIVGYGLGVLLSLSCLILRDLAVGSCRAFGGLYQTQHEALGVPASRRAHLDPAALLA